MAEPFDFNQGEDLKITDRRPRQSGSGRRVNGALHGHRFSALVFPEHADNRNWEIGNSRISKLWIQRQADRVTVFNWDRGLDIAATTEMAQELVDFLAKHLADIAFAE